MAGNFRCSNIRFNMDDPTQRNAFMFLQKHKGKKSYGKIISEALTLMNEVYSGIYSETSTGQRFIPQYSLGFNEAGMRQLAEQLAEYVVNDLRFKTWLATTGRKEDLSVRRSGYNPYRENEKDFTEPMCAEEQVLCNESGEEIKISNEMLDFAFN